MFEKFKQAIQNAIQASAPVDPAQFDDPVASRTAWTPAAGGGASFRTQRLVEMTPHRIEFRPTLGMQLFAAAFFLGGLGAIIPGVYALAVGIDGSRMPGLFLVPFGLIFGGVGAGLYYFASRPRVFDRDAMWYWKGKRPLDRGEVERRADAAPLDVIHAVQLIREHCHGEERSYYSYELNLVLDDGSRINVVDHGKLSAIREDASRIADFVDVPVWDAA